MSVFQTSLSCITHPHWYHHMVLPAMAQGWQSCHHSSVGSTAPSSTGAGLWWDRKSSEGNELWEIACTWHWGHTEWPSHTIHARAVGLAMRSSCLCSPRVPRRSCPGSCSPGEVRCCPNNAVFTQTSLLLMGNVWAQYLPFRAKSREEIDSAGAAPGAGRRHPRACGHQAPKESTCLLLPGHNRTHTHTHTPTI